MVKFLTVAILLLNTFSTKAQQLSQVTFSGGSDLSYFTFIGDQDILIRVSSEGKILEFGTEVSSIRNANYYSPQLLPYIGRIDYYGPEADSAYRGKIRSIGSSILTYFGSYDIATKVGKLRSIGRIQLNYFDDLGRTSPTGKLKQIGNYNLDYYYSSDNEAYKEKLKSFGNNTITYHSSFDDKNIRGKVKSIGSVPFEWYTSFDRNRYGLKLNNYRTNINGVNFVLW